MKRIKMEGKRKRKSGVFSPELGPAKTGFHCEQSVGVDYSEEEDDGVHGGRMRPLASLEVNRHLLLERSLHGGFANSTITKKIVSPSAVTAAAKITARAREKARICLLEDNKENAFPKGAAGFRPFRGLKRKATPEGSRTKALQVTNLDCPGKILNAIELEFQAGTKDGSIATDDAHTGRGIRQLLQFPCKSNSAWTEPAEVQTVSVQLSQSPNSNRFFDTDALCSESRLQSSQDSSKPLQLAQGEKALEPESIATPVDAAGSEVKQALQGTREGSINAPQHSRLVQKTFLNDGPAGTTTIRPVALPLSAEAHPIKTGSSSPRQIRHQLSCGSMQESSSPSDLKQASPVIGRWHGDLKTIDHPTYQDSRVSHVQNVMHSRLRILGTQAVAHAGRISDQPSSKLRQQHAADVPKPETSGQSTMTVRRNPNLARQSSSMSSSQPLPPTGRKPRVFKGRPDSLDGLDAQPPCLQNLDCKALYGNLRGDQKETPGRAFSNNELNGPLFSHQSRLGPRYLPLPPRQLNNRTKKTGYSKFRPNSLDAGKDVKADNKKPVELAEPIGLLGEFNPGIISRIRDCKQVQAILGAVVGSQAMEATASVRMQRKEMQDRNQAETALSHTDLRNPCEGVAVADWLQQSGEDKTTASVGRMADVKEDYEMDVGAHSQLGVRAYERERKNPDSPCRLQGCRAAKDHHGIPPAEVKDDDCKMSQATDTSHSAGHVFQMDPKTSGAAATVACRWLELVGMDIKGRLAALKRSRRRFRSAVGSGELDIEVGPLVVPSTGAETDLKPHQPGQRANQWKTLFMNMDGMLSTEGGKLERSLKQVTEMQVNCRQALESGCDPTTSGRSPAERKERELILAASAASIFSAANFASMLCN